jgi:hypothetical protein
MALQRQFQEDILPMTRIIVLLNLKPGKTAEDYERWAVTTDLPTVNGLQSVDSFELFQATGVLGSDAPSPYQYIEVIDVTDMGLFGQETGTETMARVAGEFQTWADPIFIVTNKIGGAA